MQTTNTENMPKVRRSVSLDKELLDWVNEQIKQKRFSDVSHSLNYALYHLKQEDESKKK